MELFELTIEEKMDEVFAISLVENPAIESDFIYFGKEEIQFAKVDEEQRMLIGPVLIPDKKILRVDGEGKPYQVYLSKDTIKLVAQNYLMKKYTDKATLEHDKTIKGVHLVESWIKEGRLDKSNSYGLAGLPEGTWMGMFKITDDRLWNDYIKTGIVKGFSIEGLFSHKLIHASKSYLLKDVNDLTESEAKDLLNHIHLLLKAETKLEESYSDYPDGVKGNARRGIELNEKNNNKCATQVGKVRAQQLGNGEPISVETIKRMYSYLSRAEAYYDETDMNACGTISYLLWGGKAALGWSRNKLRELGLLNESEGNPSIPNSSYPGQKASGSISPAMFAEDDVCPPATQNIPLNLANRQRCIDEANYGPLNPNEPNESYWIAKSKMFGDSVKDAKTALCGNCAAFIKTKKILDCIATGIGGDDAWDTIEAGDLGYCEFYDFKCASNRTCDAWVGGGPVTMAEVGPRGGIKESPKSPKGDTPNPNPKGEGTAKGDASGKSAKVTAEQEKTLQGKVDDFNERESNTKNGRATLGQLKSVFQRGLGAFNTSHSPVVKSAEQWAYARVNAYLYLLKNGRPESPKYTTDNDLLPKGHPKAS
jgi:hypothetical protein